MGVVRRDDGTLHFFVNGAAQGPAAWNVPPNVYAVVDLYGQAAQATIVEDGGELLGGTLGTWRLGGGGAPGQVRGGVLGGLGASGCGFGDTGVLGLGGTGVLGTSGCGFEKHWGPQCAGPPGGQYRGAGLDLGVQGNCWSPDIGDSRVICVCPPRGDLAGR